MIIKDEVERRISEGESKEIIISQLVSEGAKRDTVRRAYNKIICACNKINSKSGRSLSEFKKTYDKNTYIPQKIKAALKELGEAWEYESEFVQRSGVSYSDLNIFREMFSDNHIYLKKEGKKIWCGTPSFANKIRELI